MQRPLSCLVIVGLLAGCASDPAPGQVHIADIHGLALDPAEPTRLYVATHHGLFRAENDTHWSAVTKEPFDMMGFAMHPQDGRIMYASGHPGRAGQGWAVGVVKSTDAGRTWNTVALRNEVDFHAMTMEAVAGKPDTIYGFHGGRIRHSGDGGKTWQQVPVTFHVAGLAVEPASGDVLAATDAGLRRAPRLLAGAWQTVLDADVLGVATTESAILAYVDGSGLQRSVDRGQTWSSLNWTAPPKDYPWGIAATEDGQTIYAATARGLIDKTADGGTSWRRVR